MELTEAKADGSLSLRTAVSVRDGSETVECAIEADEERLYHVKQKNSVGSEATVATISEAETLYDQLVGAVQPFTPNMVNWDAGSVDEAEASFTVNDDAYNVRVSVEANSVNARVSYAGGVGTATCSVSSPEAVPSLQTLKDEAYDDSGESRYVDACVGLYDDYFNNSALELSWNGTMIPTGKFALELKLLYGSEQLDERRYKISSPQELPTPWQEFGALLDEWRTAVLSELSIPENSTVQDDMTHVREHWERDDSSTVTLHLLDVGDEWTATLSIEADNQPVQVSAGAVPELSSVEEAFESHRSRYEELNSHCRTDSSS